MTDVALTTNGVTFTFAEGEVKKISSKISANTEQQEISGTGPSSAYTYDFQGATKTITITGILFDTDTTRVSGYSIDTIIEQKQWLESLVNGTQLPITFTSNYETLSIISATSPVAPYQGAFGNTLVKVQDMSFDEFEGLVEELAFSITFIVGQ